MRIDQSQTNKGSGDRSSEPSCNLCDQPNRCRQQSYCNQQSCCHQRDQQSRCHRQCPIPIWVIG